MTDIAVFGLGFVGREVAVLSVEKGFDVHGIDPNPNAVYRTETEVPHDHGSGTFTPYTDAGELPSELDVDVYIIAVPTPLDDIYNSDFSYLESAVISTVDHIKRSEYTGQLISVESTVPPGTTLSIVGGALEDAGLTLGSDVFLAHVPERIDPGNETWPLERIPRVVGAESEAGLRKALSFYGEILDAELHPVDSTKVAEGAKMVENAYRDVNIAFVNELAVSFDALDLDINAVLDAAESKPFGFTRFSPGAGVGGHCIPVDPYMLIEEAKRAGFDHVFLRHAREVNDFMPHYVAEKTVKALNANGVLPSEAKVLLLGKAFKPNLPDTRNTPHDEIARRLREEYSVHVETYDPTIPESSTTESPYEPVDAVVLVTVHDEFTELDLDRMANRGVRVFVDGRNAYEPSQVSQAGLHYVGIGRPEAKPETVLLTR
jgi:nucleotide sugar dehydrogenase